MLATSSSLALAALSIIIIGTVFSYNKLIQKQNLKMIDFYLNEQLINQLLQIINNNESNYALNKGMNMILNYYQLNGIMLYRSDQLEPLIGSLAHPIIKQYIESYLHSAHNQPNAKDFSRNFKISGNNISIYFLSLCTKNEDKKGEFIILIREEPLNYTEFSTIQNIIRNIMVIMLKSCKNYST